MKAAGQGKTYPTVSDHEAVKCPQCGNKIKGKPWKTPELTDAQWGQRCGPPCYGTAWYNFVPEPPVTWADWNGPAANADLGLGTH